MVNVSLTPRLLCVGFAAGVFSLLAGCAGTAWQTPVTPEMHQDVKNFVDFQIGNISQLERRLEHCDSKEDFIATLDFATSSAASTHARHKLLVARYPQLASRGMPPSPIKEEFERLLRFLKSKQYVAQSLQAGAVRYASHPSVMQALQRFVATTSRKD